MKILLVTPSKTLNNVSESSFKNLIDNICTVQRGLEPVFRLSTKGSVLDLYVELHIKFNIDSDQRYFEISRSNLDLWSLYQTIKHARYSIRPYYIICKD